MLRRASGTSVVRTPRAYEAEAAGGAAGHRAAVGSRVPSGHHDDVIAVGGAGVGCRATSSEMQGSGYVDEVATVQGVHVSVQRKDLEVEAQDPNFFDADYSIECSPANKLSEWWLLAAFSALGLTIVIGFPIGTSLTFLAVCFED